MDNLLSVRLEAHRPDRNHHRFYELRIGRDFFGQWTLTICYGRIGQAGRFEHDMREPLDTPLQGIHEQGSQGVRQRSAYAATSAPRCGRHNLVRDVQRPGMTQHRVAGFSGQHNNTVSGWHYIFGHRPLPPRIAQIQQAPQQRGFPAAQKPRHHGYRNLLTHADSTLSSNVLRQAPSPP